MEQQKPSCKSRQKKKDKKSKKSRKSRGYGLQDEPQIWKHTGNISEPLITGTNWITYTEPISPKINVTLKLLVDTKAKRVVFGETGKEFVDFLFSLMSLPIGTVVSLLSCNEMVGSFGRLYKSFESLNECGYIKPNVDKEALLKTKENKAVHYQAFTDLLSLADNVTSLVYKSVHSCAYCLTHVSFNATDNCPRCGYTMSYAMPFIEQRSSGESDGYVEELFTYMVMDDLEVKPMSGLSSIIALFNKFDINDVGVLEERVVSLGVSEGLKLLKASLESKTALTNVFLEKHGQ